MFSENNHLKLRILQIIYTKKLEMSRGFRLALYFLKIDVYDKKIKIIREKRG